MTSSPDTRSRVTVFAGFSDPATESVARTLMTTAGHRLILVSHDLSGIRDGIVYRSVRTAGELLESGLTEMEHGCASCTLREDVMPTLVRLSRQFPGDDILLVLPPAIEPEAVAAAAELTMVDGTPVTDAVRFDSFTTVVDAATFVADLTSSDALSDRGMHAADNDDRAVADVLCHQVEFADTVVVARAPLAESLVRRLAPWAERVRTDDSDLARRVLRTGRHDPAVPGLPARALHGYPIGLHEPAGDNGVTAMLFDSRRPFHPGRLHDALDELTGEALRSRGQLWLASQGDLALAWECAAGNLMLGSLGHWLAALPRRRWDEAGDLRRLAADAAWDPYYGDRRTALSFIGIGLDTAALTARPSSPPARTAGPACRIRSRVSSPPPASTRPWRPARTAARRSPDRESDPPAHADPGGVGVGDHGERARGHALAGRHPGGRREQLALVAAREEEDVRVAGLLAVVELLDAELLLEVDHEVADVVDPLVVGGHREVDLHHQGHAPMIPQPGGAAAPGHRAAPPSPEGHPRPNRWLAWP